MLSLVRLRGLAVQQRHSSASGLAGWRPTELIVLSLMPTPAIAAATAGVLIRLKRSFEPEAVLSWVALVSGETFGRHSNTVWVPPMVGIRLTKRGRRCRSGQSVAGVDRQLGVGRRRSGGWRRCAQPNSLGSEPATVPFASSEPSISNGQTRAAHARFGKPWRHTLWLPQRH